MSQQCEAIPQPSESEQTEKNLLKFFGREPKTGLEERVFNIFQKHLYSAGHYSNYGQKSYLRLKEVYAYRYGGVWSLLKEDGSSIEYQADVCYASLKRAKVPSFKNARYIFLPFPGDKEAKRYQVDPSPEYTRFVEEETGKRPAQKETVSIKNRRLWVKEMKEMFNVRISHGKNKIAERHGILLDLEDENLTPTQLLAAATIYRYTWEYADCVVPTLELVKEGCSFLLSLAITSGFLFHKNTGHMLPFVSNQTYDGFALSRKEYQYPGVFGDAFSLYWFLRLPRKEYQKHSESTENSLKEIISRMGTKDTESPYGLHSYKFSWNLSDKITRALQTTYPRKVYPRGELDIYNLFHPEIDEAIKKSPCNLDNLVNLAAEKRKA